MLVYKAPTSIRGKLSRFAGISAPAEPNKGNFPLGKARDECFAVPSPNLQFKSDPTETQEDSWESEPQLLQESGKNFGD